MSEFISGDEAKKAWANGEIVQWRQSFSWSDLGAVNTLGIFDDEDIEFRLKPRTITINGIEVPAPFKPEEGERFYYFSDEYKTGYASSDGSGFYGDMSLGVWRTEEEIKQVVAALRSIFGKK